MPAWTIREASTADAVGCGAVYNHYVATSIATFDVEPMEPLVMAAKIERALHDHTFLVAVEDARLLGFAYAGSFKDKAAYAWTCETTIYLNPAELGRGVGRELYGRLLEVLAERGFRVVTGCLALPNQASVALHEALGFEQVAMLPRVAFKFGQWQDMGWWQREIGAGTASAQPPTEPLR